MNGSGLVLEPELNLCNGSYHAKAQTVATGPVLPPKTRHLNLPTWATIKYLSSDCIVTSSICRLCSFSRSFTSRIQISDLTNILGAALGNPQISLTVRPYFTATQRISVGSQVSMLEVKELIKLRNVRSQYVTIWSALKNFIAAKAVGTEELELWSGSNQATIPQFYYRTGSQPALGCWFRFICSVQPASGPPFRLQPRLKLCNPEPLLTVQPYPAANADIPCADG